MYFKLDNIWRGEYVRTYVQPLGGIDSNYNFQSYGLKAYYAWKKYTNSRPSNWIHLILQIIIASNYVTGDGMREDYKHFLCGFSVVVVVVAVCVNGYEAVLKPYTIHLFNIDKTFVTRTIFIQGTRV